MGFDWTCSHLLARSNLFRTFLVLRPRRHPPSHFLARRKEMAQVANKVPDGTTHPRWCRIHSTSNTTQLPLLGYRRVHFPETDPAEVLRLVVKTQLPDKRWTRFGTRFEHFVHFLCLHDERCGSTEMVGQYDYNFNNGCNGHGSPGFSCSRRTFRTQQVVRRLSNMRRENI